MERFMTLQNNARGESRLVHMHLCNESLLVDISARSNIRPASSIAAFAGPLLPLLQNLTACVFDGALYQETPSQLVRLQTLQSLEFCAAD